MRSFKPTNRAYRFYVLPALILFVSAPFLAATGVEERPSNDGIRVWATTTIIADVVSEVAGEEITVESIVPLGQNPHSYEPTPQQIARIERADVIFTNGLQLEENTLDILQAVAPTKLIPLTLQKDLPNYQEEERDTHSSHEEHGEKEHHEESDHHHVIDPHVWFDPLLVALWPPRIADALSRIDPPTATRFHANADSYQERLYALDKELRVSIESLPLARRKLIVDHLSLTYFAERYNLTVIGTVLPGATDQTSPSARQVAQLVEIIEEHDLPAIFVGGTAGSSLIELTHAVAAEVSRPVEVGTLLTGSLAPRGQEGETYMEYMRYNTAEIIRLLSR